MSTNERARAWGLDEYNTESARARDLDEYN